MSKKLKKVDAITSVLEPIVAKSDDLKHQLYQKVGKSGAGIRGRYVLVTFHKFKAVGHNDAIEKANEIIDSEGFNMLASEVEKRRASLSFNTNDEGYVAAMEEVLKLIEKYRPDE